MATLAGIRIVELAETVAGEFCGKLLADLGADVIKIERPGDGSPTRRLAPLIERPAQAAGVAGETSALFAWLNTNKRSITLDPVTPTGSQQLQQLLAAADVAIDDHGVDWLAARGLPLQAIEAAHPDLLFCSIAPFGLDDGRGRAAVHSINVQSESGWGYHTPSAADPSRPPLKGAGRFLPDYEGGLEAASCILAALHWRQRSGRGQRIDICQRDVLLSRADLVVGRMLAGDDQPSHARSAYDQAGPSAFFACADGAVYLYITNQRHWRGLQQLLGDPDWMRAFDPDWLEFDVTPERVATFRAGFRQWVASRHKVAVSDAAQQLGVPLVPVNDAADLHASPQFRHRRYFTPLSHPVLGEALYPGMPYRLSATPVQLRSGAPRLGEHNGATFAPRPRQAPPRGDAASHDGSRGPLAGVRVLTITKVWAGPYAGKQLALLGAEVIKLESHTNMDELRAFGGTDLDAAPYYLSVNQEVLSAQLNLKSEAGLQLVRELIAHCDVVIDNLRPGALERLGLGYEALRAVKPDIIAVSIKMWGSGGPLGMQTGYAPCFAALGGLSQLAGYEGEPPLGVNMRYGDSTVGAWAVLATLAALRHRETTGAGQFVDLSAVECMASMAGDSLLGYALTGHLPAADGNRHADLAPHGYYPCRDGSWISIAVGSDAEWQRLCHLLGDPALADDARFARHAQRQANQTAIDERLARLTGPEQAETLVRRLRDGGIAAGRCLSSLDLVGDSELWQRQAFRIVTDSRGRQRPVTGPGWRFSRSHRPLTRGAPLLGEHNGRVFGEILGMSEERIGALQEEQVIY